MRWYLALDFFPPSIATLGAMAQPHPPLEMTITWHMTSWRVGVAVMGLREGISVSAEMPVYSSGRATSLYREQSRYYKFMLMRESQIIGGWWIKCISLFSFSFFLSPSSSAGGGKVSQADMGDGNSYHAEREQADALLHWQHAESLRPLIRSLR